MPSQKKYFSKKLLIFPCFFLLAAVISCTFDVGIVQPIQIPNPDSEVDVLEHNLATGVGTEEQETAQPSPSTDDIGCQESPLTGLIFSTRNQVDQLLWKVGTCGEHVQLSTQTNAFGHADVVWMDNDGNTVNITQNISGGKLMGWLQTRDTNLRDYLARLDTLAGEMIAQVNSFHTAGFDLNGIGGEVYFAGTSAADISLNSNIDGDVNLIAAAVTASGIAEITAMPLQLRNYNMHW